MVDQKPIANVPQPQKSADILPPPEPLANVQPQLN